MDVALADFKFLTIVSNLVIFKFFFKHSVKHIWHLIRPVYTAGLSSDVGENGDIDSIVLLLLHDIKYYFSKKKQKKVAEIGHGIWFFTFKSHFYVYLLVSVLNHVKHVQQKNIKSYKNKTVK